MTALSTRTTEKTKSSTILLMIAGKDGVDIAENFIRVLAQKFTASREESEAAAAQEILLIFGDTPNERINFYPPENLLIMIMARRRLIERLQSAQQNLWQP